MLGYWCAPHKANDPSYGRTYNENMAMDCDDEIIASISAMRGYGALGSISS